MKNQYKIVLSLSLVALLAAGCNKSVAPVYNTPANNVNTPANTSANQSSTNSTNDNMNSNTGNTTGSNSSNTTVLGGKATAMIVNMAFTPNPIKVKKGTTVTWTNQDVASHTVTGDNGGPNSSTIATGQSYSFTFNTVGTFNYHCAIHPSMKGSVIVTE